MAFSMRVRRDNRSELKQKIREAAVPSLDDAAHELLRVANETVPYREGVLQGSGEVGPVDEAALTVDVSYGGEASAYAARQHEDMTLSHPGGGRAKWLEMAAKENARRLGVEIGVGIKERM